MKELLSDKDEQIRRAVKTHLRTVTLTLLTSTAAKQPELLLRRNFRGRRTWDNINSRRQPVPPQGHKKNLQEAVSLPLTHSLPPLQFSSNIPAPLSFLKTSYSGLWGQKKLVLNCGYLGGGGWWRVSVVLHSATTTITGKNTCEEWAEPVWQR